MENKDKNKFSSVMYGLAGNFGGRLSKDDLKLRYKALINYSVNDISKAGTWLLKHRKKEFPAVPTTKEIIDAIEKVSGNLGKKAKANLEADKVMKNLNFFGRECPTKFKDPITAYLMTYRWSFYKLGMMDEKELKWWRKDFIEAYQDTEKDKDLYLDTAEKAGLIPAENLKKLIE